MRHTAVAAVIPGAIRRPASIIRMSSTSISWAATATSRSSRWNWSAVAPWRNGSNSSRTRFARHRVARQLTEALRSCLQFDILHGDIKPSNILLTEAGVVKLSDFGLASRLSVALHGSTGITGTPHYLDRNEPPGAADDV